MGGQDMKRLGFLIMTAAVLPMTVLSCQKQELTGDSSGNDGRFTIKAFLDSPDTRTSMTPSGEEGKYSVFWNEEDRINLNGSISESISIQEDRRAAEFTFLQAFEAPLYAAYPANAAAYDAGMLTVDLPSVQTWTESDQFDPAAAVMLAYSAEQGTLHFTHAMAYLRITLSASADNHNIATVVLAANDSKPLSGQFTAAYTDGWTMTAAEGSGASVELDCGETGAPLGSRMVIAIPAGEYVSGLNLLIMDVNGDWQMKKAVNSFSAKAGGIYDMGFPFEPEGKATENDIFSVSDWDAFARKVADGETFEGQTVNLMADLTVPGYFSYASGTFQGTFNGNGRTMTANGNIWPLFGTIGENGTVKNLNFDGKFARFANSGAAGNAVIAKVNLGTVSDVTNYADTDVSTTGSTIFGSIVAHNGGILERCKNYGNIIVTHTSATASTAAFYGGGISAIGHTVLGGSSLSELDVDSTCKPGIFIDCENHGSINAVSQVALKDVGSTKSAYGGICGMVYMDGVKFSGCKNYGDISRLSDGEASNSGSTSVGGILGRSAGWYLGSALPIDNGDSNGFDTIYENCSNEGTILVKCRHSGGITAATTCARVDYAGGIVGAAVGKDSSIQKLTGCTNTGKITGGWTTEVNTTALGGIAGLATVAEISGCTSECELMSIDETHFVGAAGGLVAIARKDVTVSGNCRVSSVIDVYTYSEKPLFTGLVFGNIVTSASVSDTAVSGSISEDGADLGVTAENFQSFITDSASNAQPQTSNLTWNE